MAITASSRIRSPARYATPKNTGNSVTAVPRSGCLAISSRGTAVNMPPTTRSLVFRAPRRFSPRYIARISATTRRANSEGCRLKEPTVIHRWRPSVSSP